MAFPALEAVRKAQNSSDARRRDLSFWLSLGDIPFELDSPPSLGDRLLTYEANLRQHVALVRRTLPSVEYLAFHTTARCCGLGSGLNLRLGLGFRSELRPGIGLRSAGAPMTPHHDSTMVHMQAPIKPSTRMLRSRRNCNGRVSAVMRRTQWHAMSAGTSPVAEADAA